MSFISHLRRFELVSSYKISCILALSRIFIFEKNEKLTDHRLRKDHSVHDDEVKKTLSTKLGTRKKI